MHLGLSLIDRALEPDSLRQSARRAEQLKRGAMVAVSDELVDELALVGPPGHVREQLAAWKTCPIDTLIVEADSDDVVTQLAELW